MSNLFNFGNAGYSPDARNLLGALTNRTVDGAFPDPSSSSILQGYSQKLIDAAIQQATDAIMRIAPREEVSSPTVTSTEIVFDRHWWRALANETTPNVGFLETSTETQQLRHRGAGVRVHTSALLHPAGQAEFRELLYRQARGIVETMCVLTVRKLHDTGLVAAANKLAGATASPVEQVAALKATVGAGARADTAGPALSRLVASIVSPTGVKPVVLIDPADAGWLTAVAAGITTPSEDQLPRPAGVETPAAGPLMSTPVANIYGTPHAIRRSVLSNGQIARTEQSLLSFPVTTMEYATMSSEAAGGAIGNSNRFVEVADYGNGHSWRRVGFDDALRAGAIGDENVVSGPYSGNNDADRDLPWNAVVSNGMVSKAVVLGQLDEAILPSYRLSAATSTMARNRSVGGEAEFDRRVGELNILLGRIASAAVTPDFIDRLGQSAAGLEAGSNMVPKAEAAGWVTTEHIAAVNSIPQRRVGDSELPPGLLSATGLSALLGELNGWASEGVASAATNALAFLASVESSLAPMAANNVLLGAVAVPQNLPRDTQIPGGSVFHLLAQPAVPGFLRDQTANNGLGKTVAFSETNFAESPALSAGDSASGDLAPSDTDTYGPSQYAMRGGEVELRNADTNSVVTVPADVAFAYVSSLPTVSVARRLPRSYLPRWQAVGASVPIATFRQVARLVPENVSDAIRLIDYLTSWGDADNDAIAARVSSIIKAPETVPAVVAKQAATTRLPKVLPTASSNAGLSFGTGLITDFGVWETTRGGDLPYLTRDSSSAVLQSVSGIISRTLLHDGVVTNLTQDAEMRAILQENGDRPQRVQQPVPEASYIRTDLMFSPLQAQQIYELAQDAVRAQGEPILLPGDPSTGYTQPLYPAVGGYFPVGSYRTNSATASVQMMADVRKRAEAAVRMQTPSAMTGSLFTPAVPKVSQTQRVGLAAPAALSAAAMADVLSHPNMVARLAMTDGLSPAERMSALLLLGTRCDNNNSLVAAHRHGIPLPFGLALFRMVETDMHSVVAVSPGRQTAVNAIYNLHTTASMDATQNITFVHASGFHEVIVKAAGVSTAAGFMPGRVVSGGSVDFVTANNPGRGSIYVAVVPMGWTPRGDIDLTNGTSGIPNTKELLARMHARGGAAAQSSGGSILDVLGRVAVQSDIRVPMMNITGGVAMEKVVGTNFGHLAVAAQ